MSVRIRRATSAADIAKCHEMDSAVFPHDTPYRDPNAEWWLAEDEQGPVGFAALAPLKYTPELAFLSRAGVIPRARGKNLQRRLIRARAVRASTLGFDGLITYTAPNNLASANNLIAEGFRLYKSPYEWGCAHALYFYKALK